MVAGSSLPFRDGISILVRKRIGAFEKGYRQNMVFLGQSGVGKSRLLAGLYQDLGGCPGLIPMYVPADTADLEQFAERWMGALLTGLFFSQEVKCPVTLSSLMSAADPIIPRSTARMRHLKRSIRRGKVSLLLKDLFSLPSMVACEVNKQVVLMIDDFEALSRLPHPDPYQLLGKQIMTDKHTMYLMTSSYSEQAKMILHEKLSLLFGNFEIVNLKPFTFDALIRFMSAHLMRFTFSKQQIRFLIRMTNGILWYLERIVDQLKSLLGEYESTAGDTRTKMIPTDIFFTAFQRELTPGDGRTSAAFQHRLDSCGRMGKNDAAFAKALMAVASGHRKQINIAAYIAKRGSETKGILQKLAAEGMVNKCGSLYMLADPMFRFWLKEVYQRSMTIYSPDQSVLKKGLHQALMAESQDLQEEDEREIVFRVETLFKTFRGDKVNLNNKRWVMPQFSEITSLPGNGRVYPLFAKTHNQRWLCHVIPSPVIEEDVACFTEDVRKYRKNLQQKLIVALSGIDQNAKLSAQEARIQVWDLRDLNMLLDLYDLPKLILVSDDEIHFARSVKPDADEGVTATGHSAVKEKHLDHDSLKVVP